jgi:hypothetical protein
VRIKLRTAGLDDLTSIYAIRRDSILGVPSEASLSDSPEERLLPVLKKTISVGGVVPMIVLLDYTFAHHGVAEVLVV